MKKIILLVSMLLFSNSVYAGEFNCKSEYSEISQAVVIFYKALGDEVLTAAEQTTIEFIYNELDTNINLNFEVERVSTVIEEMINMGIKLDPKDQIAIIVGAYYRTCK